MTPELLQEKPVQRCIEATASIFNAVVEKSISNKAPSSFRQSLVRDVQNFSAFKTYHHLKETAEHVFKKDGSIKTWQEFLKDTAKINEKYNKNWLRAEYQFVTASAHMADKWLKFVEDKENIDLVYSTAGDHLVRPDHALLDGVCLPVDDPAWATIYPPNGWGCRCTVYSILKGSREYSDSKKAIEQMEEMTKGKEEIFRFNPGIERCLFPRKHAYYGKEGSKEAKLIKGILEQEKWEKEIPAINQEAKEVVNKLCGKKEGRRQNEPAFFAKMPKEAVLFCKEKGIELAETEKGIGISLNEDQVMHALRDTKRELGHALNKREFFLFKKAINEGEIFYEERKERKTLIFATPINERSWAKFCVQIGYKVKKYGTHNLFITAGKVKYGNLDSKNKIR